MVDVLRGVSGRVTRSPSGPSVSSTPHLSRIRPIALFVAAAFGAAGGAPSFANPEGPKVVSGSATFSQHGSTLIIKNSPGSIINWQSFSIGSGQTTDFIQQSINSVVLNRVTGVDPSVILGDLVSNGKVFLVNANGVVFGKGSMVDAAGLVVSTLDISNNDFAAGTMRFVGSGTPGDISVAGVIRSSDGDVYLIAPNVTNSGSISANNGAAVLAAGQTVDILSTGLADIKFEVQNTSNKAINLGQISGDAVGIFAGAITQAGSVNANAVTLSGGHVILSALGDTTLAAGSTTSADNAGGGAGSVWVESQGGNLSVAQGASVSASGLSGGLVTLIADAGASSVSGRIAATGSMQIGGTAEILGQSVALASPAVVDVSGATGGGTAVIGGARGATGLLASDATSIAAGASVNADATTSGNGGLISAYSTNTLSTYGALSARGGTASGNGGYIDTSAEVVDVGGTIAGNARSATGRAGTWVLDPASIFIDNGTGAATPPTNSTEVSANGIAAVLFDGTSVVIDTQVINPTNGATNSSITLNAPIAVGNNSNAVSLTFNAGGSILISPGTGVSNSGQPLTFNMTSNVDAAAGGITVSAPLSLPGGTINVTGNSFASSATITARTFNATINAAGAESFTNTGTIDASGANNGGGGGGQVTVVAPGTITTGTITASGDATGGGGQIGLTGGSVIISGNLLADAGSFTTAPGGNISISASTVSNSAGVFTISAEGGSGLYQGGFGGSIYIEGDSSIALSGITARADGGAAANTGPGGPGGEITFYSPTGSVTLTNVTLSAMGGAGGTDDPGGMGGTGGYINVTGTGSGIVIVGGSANVAGGAGGLNNTAYEGGPGGNGGVATYYSNTAPIAVSNLYVVDVGGGNGGASANGGNAGSVSFAGGDINLSGITINATGGVGGDGLTGFGTAQGPGGSGGSGGLVSLSGTSIELTNVNFSANGGIGGNAPPASGGNVTYAGGDGGNGGSIQINTPVFGGTITIVGSLMSTSGGAGGNGSNYNTSVGDPTDNTTAGYGGYGGTAGSISLNAFGDISVDSSTLEAIGGAGGQGGSLSGVGIIVAVGGNGGNGGMGGQISLNASSGNILVTGTQLLSVGGPGGDGGQSYFGAGGGGNGGNGGDSFDLNGSPAIFISASGSVTVDAVSTVTSSGGIGGAGAGASGTVQPNGTAYFLIEPGSGGNGGSVGSIEISAGTDVSYSATTNILGGNGGAGGNLTGTNITGGYMIQAGNGGNGGGNSGEAFSIYAPDTTTVGGNILIQGGNGANGGNSSDGAAPAGAGGNGGSIGNVYFEGDNNLILGGNVSVIAGGGGYSGSGAVGNNEGNGGALQSIQLYQSNFGGSVTLGGIDIEAGYGPLGTNGTGELDIYANGAITQAGGSITTTGGTFINVNASGSSVSLTASGNQFEQIEGSAGSGSFSVYTNNYLSVDDVSANNAISIMAPAGMSISSTLIAGTGGYGGIALSGQQISFYAPLVNANEDTSYPSDLSISADVIYASAGGSYIAGDGIQIGTATLGRPIWLTADSYATSGVNIYTLPELVVGQEFLAGMQTPALDIGNTGTGTLLLASIASVPGTVTIPIGTQLGLTAGAIAADNYTRLQVDSLNVVSNNAAIGFLTPSTTGGAISLAGSALTMGGGGILSIATAPNVSLIVADNTAGPFPQYGLEGYDHVTLVSDDLHLYSQIVMDPSPASTLTMQTITPSADIHIGGTGYSAGFNLYQADLAEINSTGTVTFGSPTQGGTIIVQGPVDLPGLGAGTSVVLDSPGGSVSLAAGYFNAPGPVTIVSGGAVGDPGGVVVTAASLAVEGATIGASGAPLLVNLTAGGANLAALSSGDMYFASSGAIYGAGINAGGSINISAPSIVNYYNISGAGINLTGSLDLNGTVESSGDMLLKGGNIAIGNGAQSALVTGYNITIDASNLTVAGPDSTANPAATVVDATGALTVTVSGNVNILGGAEAGASATVNSVGNSTYIVGGILTLSGGSGNGSFALIDPQAPGSILNMTAQQINLSGGSGNNAYAAIVGEGTMLLKANSISFTTGSGTNSDAVVVSHTSSPTADTTEPCPECTPTVGSNPIINSTINSGFYAESATMVVPPPPPPPPPPNQTGQSGTGEPIIDQIIGDLLTLIDDSPPTENSSDLSGTIYVDGGADGCF